MTNYRADFLPRGTLEAMPFASLGRDVMLHERVTLVGVENISIGSHVRIDPEVIILATGPVHFGDYIHIAPGVFMAGKAGITLHDFTTVAHGARLYTMNDDYSGDHLVGPTVPAEYLGVNTAPIVLEAYAQVGAGAIIMPGVTMHEGSVLGALSLLTKSTKAWTIYGGVAAKPLKERRQRAKALGEKLKSNAP